MNNDLSFTAQIQHPDIWHINKYLGLPDLDIETAAADVTVDFHLEIESRGWGVKGIDVYIDRVTTQIEWYIPSEDLKQSQIDKLISSGGIEMRNGDIEGSLKLTTDDYFKWEVKNEITVGQYGNIRPEGAEIDFENKTITIN